MGSRKIGFHPLFRVDLVQMIRHGEIMEAIERAGAELRLALRPSGDGGSGEDTRAGGGLVKVPTLQREIALGYSAPQPELGRKKQREIDRGYGR